MKVLIIGGGLIGVTTAYVLRMRGHEVTVLDRAAGAGLETSFANGALLTPSMSGPWNSPGSWRVLLRSLGRSDAPLQLHLRTLPTLARWGIRFLRNSRTAAFERSTLSNLRLSLYSLEALASLRQETRIEFGHAARGSLRVFRDEAALDRASAGEKWLESHRVSGRRLSRQETVALEPALAPIASRLAGSLHYATDETGDAYRYCVALTEQGRKLGAKFRFGTTVTSLEVRSGQVTAVMGERERFVADRYVMAACSYSTTLLRRIGIHLPVRPAKGYSVTFDCPTGETSLRVPVVDDHLHAVIVPLQGAVRVAGTAEFAGYDLSLPAARIQNLLTLLQEVLPRGHFDPAKARPWCGLRSMSADGVPIIGSTPLANLVVNTGHGHLGWTMAAGSAQLLADLMDGDATAIDAAPYALERFAG